MVEVSSGDRVVYPATGTTKAEVVGHYSSVGERMLRHVAGRPLTLERFPKGIAGKGFMQKNASDYFPDFIGRHEVQRGDAVTTHPVVNDVAGIEYLANQNTITFHVPTTTVADMWHPDRVIIDLDPPEGGGGAVRAAALATKELLHDLALPSIPLATGSKGFHVTVPIRRGPEVPDADEFGQLAAALLAHEHPDLMTIEFRKANRAGRVFCDWLRNRWGATSVSPWSLRPRERPTVAVPITWQELETTKPDEFEMGSVPEADPLRHLAETPAQLEPALEQLRARVEAAGIEIQPFDRFRS